MSDAFLVCQPPLLLARLSRFGRVSRRVHLLDSSLPAAEEITTNLDGCFRQERESYQSSTAWGAAGRPGPSKKGEDPGAVLEDLASRRGKRDQIDLSSMAAPSLQTSISPRSSLRCRRVETNPVDSCPGCRGLLELHSIPLSNSVTIARPLLFPFAAIVLHQRDCHDAEPGSSTTLLAA